MDLNTEKNVKEDVVAEFEALTPKVRSGLSTLWRYTGMVPYLHLALTLTLIGLIAYVILLGQCGPSKSDQKVSQQTDTVATQSVAETHAQVNADQAVANSKAADQRATDRQAAVVKVQSSKQKNVSLNDSTQALHQAYPETTNETPSGKTVVVTQEYVDNATQAFKENPVLKEANAALTEAIKQKDIALAAKDEVIKAKDDKISVLTDQVDTLKKTKCSETKFLWGVIKNRRCH